MRSRLGLLALAPIVLMLQGCPAPPTSTISITNNSGQRISFSSCRGDRFSLAPGESVELVNEYRYIGGPKAWKCYRKRPLVVVTGHGEDWSYTLWVHRDFEANGKAEKVSGWGAYHSYVAAEIVADGSIRLGNWDKGRFNYAAKPDFSREPQPPGFPIVPKRSPHIPKRK